MVRNKMKNFRSVVGTALLAMTVATPYAGGQEAHRKTEEFLGLVGRHYEKMPDSYRVHPNLLINKGHGLEVFHPKFHITLADGGEGLDAVMFEGNPNLSLVKAVYVRNSEIARKGYAGYVLYYTDKGDKITCSGDEQFHAAFKMPKPVPEHECETMFDADMDRFIAALREYEKAVGEKQ